MAKTPRAAIYCRISKDAAGLALGVERQLTECTALCKSRGWNVVETFTDNDISAYSGKARPGYDAMTNAMTAGAFDVLVAWHPDRLTRRPAQLEDLIDLLESTGTKVHTVQAGEYDLATPSGRLSARIVGAVARGESEHKSARLRSKLAQLAHDGAPHGGPTPFGYSRDGSTYVVNEAEADALRWMAGRVLAGCSLLRLCREADEKGIPTRGGSKWDPSSAKKALTKPAVAGLRVHRGEVAGPASWPAILDRQTWESVGAVISDPKRKRTRPAQTYVLSGLVYSSGDDKLRSQLQRGRRTYSAWAGANTSVTIDAERLEAVVVEAVLQRFDKTALKAPKAAPKNSVVEDIEAELAELAALRGEGVISLAEWLAAKGPLDRRLAEARAERPPEAPAEVLTAKGALRAAWPGLSIADQRAILASVLERVVISPTTARGRAVASTPIEERVSLEYR